jgi:hypothetical protein
MRLSITIKDDRYGTETTHDLVVEVYHHTGEASTIDCPGEEPWNEIINCWVEGSPENEDHCIWHDLSAKEQYEIIVAMDEEMEQVEPW